MDPILARALLHLDAVEQHKNLSIFEWEERIAEEKHLRDASAAVDPKTIAAIIALVWEWDKPFNKRKRR